jgi:hypothetical protein
MSCASMRKQAEALVPCQPVSTGLRLAAAYLLLASPLDLSAACMLPKLSSACNAEELQALKHRVIRALVSAAASAEEGPASQGVLHLNSALTDVPCPAGCWADTLKAMKVDCMHAGCTQNHQD